MAELDLQKISSSYTSKNPWFNVREDVVIRPDGNKTIFYVVECPDGVFIVPVADDGKIVLVKLFRYRTQRGGWEVPAGGVEPGEDPIASARRELQEETGYTAKTMRQLSPSIDAMNGSSSAVSHIFIARDIRQSGRSEQAEEGITATRAFSWQEIGQMIKTGEIVDSQSIAALLRYHVEASKE